MEEIEVAVTRAAAESEGVILISVIYRPEPGLDLFVFTLSDGRRLSVPRENLQAFKGSTPESAANFEVSPFGTEVWWTKLDEASLWTASYKADTMMKAGWKASVVPSR